MKLKIFLSYILLIQFAAGVASANCTIDQVSFLIGTWSGTGTYKNRNGVESQFQARETISPALSGKILQMEGFQTANGHIVNHALTTIAVDSSGACVFDSYVDPGTAGVLYHGVYPIAVKKQGFVWFQNAQTTNQVRYTMNINDQGQWSEVGESSKDGATWIKFFQMTLNKLSRPFR